MNLLASSVTNIPLHCNVCPKKPDFSDVSHLLTHVASKGHLSAYYKMKVKGSTDNMAKQIIDDYDEWYEEWNLEDLMRERMSSKEKRRGSGSVASSRKGSGVTTSARSTPSASTAHSSRSTRLRDNMQLLDPQLGHRLRAEQLSRSVTPVPPLSMDPVNFHRTLAPPMQNWALGGLPFDHSPLIKQESIDSSASDDDDEDSLDFAPRRRGRTRRHRPSPSIASFDEISIDDLVNDATKLKGVYWPGMDMFDSATPEMRRKRNQKKNISVLRSLQATSEVVEPTECVFDVGGVLRKERVITGNPDSDDSLIEGESEPEPEVPKKKRAPRRSRPALAEKDVNTSRVLRHRAKSHHPPFARKSKTPYFKEEDDDDLTYGASRPRKRTGLSIHRDNSGPDITFDHPAPMSYLTSGFRNPFQQSHQTYQNNVIPRTHSRQQSWGQLSSGFRANATGMSGQNFPNFSQYLNQSVGLPNHAPAFQHQMAFGPQGLHSNQNMFQVQPGVSWDFLGLDTEDIGMLGNVNNPFPLNGEMTSANPLFFGNAKDDDNATVSAGEDDR